jgi:hypothetical protein
VARSKRSSKARAIRAREAQTAQRQAERKKLSYAQYRRRRVFGWSLVALGVVVGVTHWLQHLQLYSLASQGVSDVFLGYPMAVLLGVGGAIVLSKI